MNWKKQWKAELDHALPPMRDDVREERIPTVTGRPRAKRPLVYVISSAAAVACVLVLSVVVALFASGALMPSGGFIVSAVTLEINPRVTFITDEEGVVTSVVALNEDADILLSDDARLDSLVGVPLADAVSCFTECAARSGYIDLSQPDAIRLSATGDCKEEWLASSVNALEGFFAENNIKAIVLSENLPLDGFCLRFGIENIDSKEALCDWAAESAGLALLRLSSGLSGGEFAVAYREHFVDGIYKTELTAKVEAYVEDVLALNRINAEIFVVALTDYFSVKADGVPIYAPNAEEAERLVLAMDNAIAEFHSNYGAEIDSSEALSEATLAVGDILGEFLSLWSSSIEDALSMIEGHGIAIGEGLKAQLGATPTDEESYDRAVKAAYSARLDSLIRAAKEEFEGERAPVDYAALREDIIAEYGSLEEFFLEKNK